MHSNPTKTTGRFALAMALAVGLLMNRTTAQDHVGKPMKKTIRAGDGLKLVGEVRGKGDTALVFLHGWCYDREHWKNQVEAFAADYRVVAYDQAGHGESGKDRKEWSGPGLAADVQTVVKELGLKRVILVGHSMGGPVALMAAKRMPGTVVAVIGVDTLHNAESKRTEENTKKLLESLDTDFKGAMRASGPGSLHKKTDPELAKWIIDRAAAQDPKMALELMRGRSTVDLRAIVKEAKVPVRCINSGGGFKRFVPTAVATNKKYTDYDAVFIDEVGHYPMLEKPDEFNQKLREVLKEFAARE
jgi:pimeloyl-ACP methyl ester carboxylesterase